MAARRNPTAKKGAFLAAYSRLGSITAAAEAAKIDRSTHYDWLKTDEAYKKASAEAVLQAADALEDEAARRAFAGSDVLLIFLLKGLKPEKFRERSEVKMPGLESTLASVLRAREARPK
jgi:hypothetical protein